MPNDAGVSGRLSAREGDRLTGFGGAEKEPDRASSAESVDESGGNREPAKEDDNEGDSTARTDRLDREVARNLEDNVGDAKH